jgi:hypothetical protein
MMGCCQECDWHLPLKQEFETMPGMSLRLSALALGVVLAMSQTATANASCFRQSNVRLPSLETVASTLTNGAAGQQIYRAVAAGDMVAVQSLVSANPALLTTRSVLPAGQRPSNGNVADLLTAAIAACDLSMLQTLLDLGADPNGAYPGLAMTYGVLADGPEFATALLQAGAAPDRHDPSISSPLREALMFERPDAVRLLVANGVDINRADAIGRIPLGTRFSNDPWGMYQTLIELGANPWQVTGTGVLPAYTIFAAEPRRRADRRIREALLAQIEVDAPIWPPVHAGIVQERVLNGSWPTAEMAARGFVVSDAARASMRRRAQ